MSWPTPQDYQEAMQNPRTALGDAELRSGKAKEDSLGLPRPISGGFASVYKVICSGRTWAVRCFLKKFLDQQQRYSAISAQLAKSQFSFATQFQFIPHGIRIRGDWYPILKMEWVPGEGLHRFIEKNLQSPSKLLSLGLDVIEIVRVMNKAGVAHGDLQHGNILVDNGKPKLIDYDGMYVPALQGLPTHEAGHPNYQLERNNMDFGPSLDNFSAWVIYLSLRALTIRPSLWTQFQGGDDCLLFRRKDFATPSQSLLLQELKRIPETQQLAASFESLLAYNPLDVPLLDPSAPTVPIITKRPTTDWISSHRPQPPAHTTSAAFSSVEQWVAINRISRPSDVLTFSQGPSPQAASWPLPLPLPVPPTIPSILVSPPAFPALKLPPPKFHPTLVPRDSFQNSIGVAAILFISLCPVLTLLGAVIGMAGVGRSLPNAVVFGMGFLLGAILFGVWWMILEKKRLDEERELNSEYQKERRKRKIAQRAHVERCKKRLKEQQDKARLRFDEAKAKWNAMILPYIQEAAGRREAVPSARHRLQCAEQQWKSASDAAIRLFDQKKADLQRLRDEYDNVAVHREAELKQMNARARDAQFIAHLKQHLIIVAAIPNIGSDRKATLRNNNIQTALDVQQDRILRIPGFGPALTSNLIGWRRNVEATFIFKVANAIPPHEMKALESKYENNRQLIQRQLLDGENELRRLSQDAQTHLGRLSQETNECAANLCQAEADLAAIPNGL